MSVDVVNLLKGKPGFTQCYLYCSDGTLAVLRRLGNVKGIAGSAVTDDFGKDVSPAPLGEGQVFQDKDTGSLANNKAVPLGIKGTGCQLRLLVSGGNCLTGVV